MPPISQFGQQWQFWALLAAAFAALTAIFAKLGVQDIDSDYATFIRTIVVLALLAGVLAVTGKWQSPAEVPGKAWLFLILSGAATGASWFAYFRALKLGDAARVAPLDKLSIVLVAIFGVIFLGEKLSGLNWLGVVLIMAGALLLAVKV
jgi:bacterial/archaeal transporter family protein